MKMINTLVPITYRSPRVAHRMLMI